MRRLQRLESLGQLTGGVAHDFNNLLTVILGNAEFLADALQADPALGSAASTMVRAAERGADLTQRLLAFARKQTLQPSSVDVAAAVRDLEPMLRRTLGDHVEMRIEAQEDQWNALVDPGQLDDAILNLCLNARDAMPQGGVITISTANATLSPEDVRRNPEAKAGDYVLLVVSDTGTGIPPHLLKRVFEPFFTTKQKGTGTGLGLPISRRLAVLLGGSLTVESVMAEGSMFRLVLPPKLDVRTLSVTESLPFPTPADEPLLPAVTPHPRAAAEGQPRIAGVGRVAEVQVGVQLTQPDIGG